MQSILPRAKRAQKRITRDLSCWGAFPHLFRLQVLFQFDRGSNDATSNEFFPFFGFCLLRACVNVVLRRGLRSFHRSLISAHTLAKDIWTTDHLLRSLRVGGWLQTSAE